MSRLFFRKTKRLQSIPPRSDEAQDVIIRDEEGLPICDEECPRIELRTEESDA